MPILFNQAVTSTVVTAAQTVTLINGTTITAQRFMVSCDTACWIKHGTTGVAATVGGAGCTYLPANFPNVEIFAQPGFDKVSVIRVAVDGNISFTPALP